MRASHRPEEVRIAECEHATVDRGLPIATRRCRRRDTDERMREGSRARRAEELGVAEGAHVGKSLHRVVALRLRGRGAADGRDGRKPERSGDSHRDEHMTTHSGLPPGVCRGVSGPRWIETRVLRHFGGAPRPRSFPKDDSRAILVDRVKGAGSWVASERRRLTLPSVRQRAIFVAAFAPAAAYVLCVWHFAVNAPFQDDWSVTAVVSAALHGRLTLPELWAQHAEGRLPVPYLFFIASGWINHLNLRSIVVLDALLFVATYALMLHMFRIYTKRPLTASRVLSLGVVWFCLVGLDSALWAFLLTWYLALFLVFVAIYLLLVWPRNRTLAVALAVPIAICASLSWVQGFLVWPIGLVCLLWTWTANRRGYAEVGIWLSTGLVTTLLYLRGYKAGVGCVPVGADCSIHANAGHPILFTKFFLSLVANAVPLRVLYARLAVVQLGPGFMQLLGAVLCLASLFVIVRSVQERRGTKLPLPLLLILLALLFDLSIALGRAHEGVPAALQGRFAIPNLLLLVGLLTYAWSHLPQPRARRAPE